MGNKSFMSHEFVREEGSKEGGGEGRFRV